VLCLPIIRGKKRGGGERERKEERRGGDTKPLCRLSMLPSQANREGGNGGGGGGREEGVCTRLFLIGEKRKRGEGGKEKSPPYKLISVGGPPEGRGEGEGERKTGP